jgi:hypothetical protein
MIDRRRGIALMAVLALLAVAQSGPLAAYGALVSFETVTVPPVGRGETNELIDAGILDVEGYRDVVLSIGGELKKGSVGGGSIGAILMPEKASFEFVRRNERLYPFPMEVAVKIQPNAPPVFVGEQVVARVAFPRYRVLFYNSTGRTATVSLFAYRSH